MKDGTNSTWKQNEATERKDGTMREKLVNVELLENWDAIHAHSLVSKKEDQYNNKNKGKIKCRRNHLRDKVDLWPLNSSNSWKYL